MGQNSTRILRVILVTFTVVTTCFAGLVWARPGIVACAFITQTSLMQWEEKKYSESTNSKDHERYDYLLRQARERIKGVYGESISDPTIVFFDSTKPIPFYEPNPYGSSQFVGGKACVFIGPEGQNVDVLAHEIVHTDILNILGAYDRTLHLPVWLDEGLAMQVDFRPRYNLERPNFQDLANVDSWISARDFYGTTEEGELVNRYALAKSRVGMWVENFGSNSIYKNLKTQISGGMSQEVRDAGLTER